MKHLIIFSIVLVCILLAIITCYDTLHNKNLDCLIQQFPYNIYLKQSKVGGKLGRGVFANKNFNQDDVVEKAPYIEDKTDNFVGLIRDYIFNKDPVKKLSIVAFGYGSMYNHSDTPNATWKIMDDYILITTIKPIQMHDEILISYGDTYWHSRKDIKQNLD